MPIDLARVKEQAARIKELQDQGYSDATVQEIVERESDVAARQYGYSNAAAARIQLQEQRGALNADAASPGEQPDEDPVARAFAQADQSGAQRGSNQRMEAFTAALFEAAQAGDPRVSHQGTVTEEVKQRWMADAHQRQIANREQSGMRRR
jgi:hypothetical protein